MIPVILALAISADVSASSLTLDSAGRRRPQVRLPALAVSWSPAVLSRVDTVNKPTLTRRALAEVSAPFEGKWTRDFPKFRKLWPKAVADGSWPALTTGFWRAITGLNQDFGDEPSREEWATILDEWDAFIESADPRLRATLGEMTGREFCRQGKSLSRQVVNRGEGYSLDLSPARLTGPVVARVQKYRRKGLEFDRLDPAKGPGPWDPSSGAPWRITLPEPGVYRVVLRSKAWYQQVLLQVTDVGTMAIPTDSGALLWAPGGKAKRLVWKTPKGKLDSMPLGDAPVHIGLPADADSGLVGVASGQDLSPLRLRRARPRQESIVFGDNGMDWYGRPVMSRVGKDGLDFAWAGTVVATPDALEPGQRLRISGIVRRLDAYGRPDEARADSVEVAIDTGRGPSIQRVVLLDSSGVWTDSVTLGSSATISLERLWDEGRTVSENLCRMVSVRVRDPARGTLPSRRRVDERVSRDEVRTSLSADSSALLLLVSGRAIDWRYPIRPSDTSATVAPQPGASGGWSLDRLGARGPSWSHERIAISYERPSGGGWMDLSVEGVPDSADAGGRIGMRVRTRDGSPTDATVFLSIARDSLAGDLDGLSNLLGKAWARSEMNIPDQATSSWGVNNMVSPIADHDQAREPDRFVRLGILGFPRICVMCRPWTGSYSGNPLSTFRYQEPCSMGFSYGSDLSAPQPLPEALWMGPTRVSSQGGILGDLRWPSTPGRYTVQVWGIDSQGRLLAWEKSLDVR